MGYKKVNVIDAAERLHNAWMPVIIGSVDNYDVKVAVFEGQFYYKHKHVEHDEFIYVLDGEVSIEFDEEEVNLKPGEGIFIEKGTGHRSKSKERSLIMVVEKNTISEDYVKVK